MKRSSQSLAKKEKALLVTVDTPSESHFLNPEDSSRELIRLAKSCGLEIAENIICKREKITPDLHIGKGKVDEIALICLDEKIDVVVFNNDLSGTQQRNIEEIVNRKTIDRTQLILDIFARHAKTPEGKMQVELAQLEYLVPRLSGKGIMLSRLGGGIGTRGPGEQKLEVDRRRIKQRIFRVQKGLVALKKRRQALRANRRDAGLALISLIGYTNAGKSTLMNYLTDAHTVADNNLFTTLDPLARKFKLPNNQSVIFSDTVGFIDRLPHHLIEAFEATLEEVRNSQLLLHVVDVSSELFQKQHKAVMNVLGQLEIIDKPMITILNKIDKMPDRSWLEHYKSNFKDVVCISALNGENVKELQEKIADKLSDLIEKVELKLPISRMDLVNRIYNEGDVLKIEYFNTHIIIKAVISKITAEELKKNFVR